MSGRTATGNAWRHGRLAGWAWSGLLLLILTFLVIYPIAMLLLGTLTDSNPVTDGYANMHVSLGNFITVLGNLTALKVAKVWVPDYAQFVSLRDKWIEEWNTVYGHRQ